MPNAIHKVWTFKSSSSDKTYQTLQYSDGSTSCDCNGWTRRAIRSCRHTRSVDLGQADAEAINFHEYPKPHKAMLHTGEIVTVQGAVVINEEKPTPNRVGRAATFTRPKYGNRKLCI